MPPNTNTPYRENVTANTFQSPHCPFLSLCFKSPQTRFGSEIERMSPLSIAPDEASVTPIKSTRNSSES